MKAKKILTCLIVNIFVIILFSGNVNVFAEEKYNYTCDYMYNILETEAEKNFYDNLYVNCEIVDNSKGYYEYTPYTPYGSLTFDQAQEIAFIFSQDHPEYFWLSAQTKFSSIYGVSYKLIDDFRNGNIRQLAKTQINAAIQKYINGAKRYSTDFGKVKYFCNELLSNADYAFGDWDQTIASVFLQNKTVCEGYSKAFELLCNAVGIDSVILTSCVHAWNAVKIDDRWYLIDVTNNAPSNKYFLISDSKMAEIDKSMGIKYNIRLTINNEEKVYEIYPHDIDYLTYINYYNQFPQCKICYSELPDATIASILGDANFDGVLNIRDAAYIAKMIAKGKRYILPDSADYNEDGNINIGDAAEIAKYIARRNI